MGDGAIVKPRHAVQMQDYRNLRVWRHVHHLALEIRRVSRGFPRSGHASLSSQIARAAESISFNIAEGCGATSQREFARFLDISIKSTLELEAQLELTKDYGILGSEDWKDVSRLVIDVRRMLCGLRSKVISSTQKSSEPIRPT
jgi:four helix bundle protein